MTLQVYAQRKGWPLQQVVSTLSKIMVAQDVVVEKKIQVWGDLTPTQVQALKKIAEKCPINQFIIGGTR